MHPERFLGLEVGDAHMIRNAGGRVSDDALRSLVVSSRLLGTREVAVIHHTDCGMRDITNDLLRTTLGPAAEEVDFLPLSDPRRDLEDDVARVRSSPLMPDGVSVSGWIYDVTTGRLEPVVAAT